MAVDEDFSSQVSTLFDEREGKWDVCWNLVVQRVIHLELQCWQELFVVATVEVGNAVDNVCNAMLAQESEVISSMHV